MAVTLREVRLGFHHERQAPRRRGRLAGLGAVAAPLTCESELLGTNVGNCSMRELDAGSVSLAGLGDLVFVVT